MKVTLLYLGIALIPLGTPGCKTGTSGNNHSNGSAAEATWKPYAVSSKEFQRSFVTSANGDYITSTDGIVVRKEDYEKGLINPYDINSILRSPGKAYITYYNGSRVQGALPIFGLRNDPTTSGIE